MKTPSPHDDVYCKVMTSETVNSLYKEKKYAVATCMAVHEAIDQTEIHCLQEVRKIILQESFNYLEIFQREGCKTHFDNCIGDINAKISARLTQLGGSS